MNQKLFKLAALVISALVLFTACEKIFKPVTPVEKPILLESITHNAPSSIELSEEDTPVSYQVSFTPKGATVKDVKVSSSNPGVVTVSQTLNKDNKGNITGAVITITPVAEGNAEITIEAEGKKASLNVTVKKKEDPIPPTPVEPTLSTDEYIVISYNEGDGSTRYIRLATKNLGANSSTEVGYYLSWGESEEKESYANNIYNFTNQKGYVLRPYEDPATVLWGNEWRTPSSAELKFIKACATTYSIDDVNGRLITGDNGTYTFMPAGGYKYNKEHLELNVSMGYWGNQISYSTYEDAVSWYSLATIFNGEVIAGDFKVTSLTRIKCASC